MYHVTYIFLDLGTGYLYSATDNMHCQCVNKKCKQNNNLSLDNILCSVLILNFGGFNEIKLV